MKIKKPTKKIKQPAVQVKSIITTLTTCSEENIIKISKKLVTQITSLPKSDFFQWIPVLNRFDVLLDTFIKNNHITQFTHSPLPSLSKNSKNLILAVLSISRVLWENCTSRNLYSSFEHLADLLYSRDLDILEATLKLLVKPSQRISNQRSLRFKFPTVTERVAVLATFTGQDSYLGAGKEDGESSNLGYQFYRNNSAIVETGTAAIVPPRPITPATPATPFRPTEHVFATPALPSSSNATTSSPFNDFATPAPVTPAPFKSASQDGFVSISISQPHKQILAFSSSSSPTRKSSKSATTKQMYSTESEMLNDLFTKYNIPADHQFPLFHRLRSSIIMGVGSREEKEKLLVIRFLSLAVYLNTVSEDLATSKVFLYEPGLVGKSVEMLSDVSVNIDIQISSIILLEAILHFRGKQSEVLTAISASANHGIIMYSLTRVVAFINSKAEGSTEKHDEISQEYINVLFGFVNYLISLQSGGNMFITAGIIKVLVSVMEKKNSSQSKNITKCFNLLDSLLYQFPNALAAFVGANGINILVKRIKDEVDDCVNDQVQPSFPEGGGGMVADYMEGLIKEDKEELPHERISYLRGMMKFILHLMQTSGTADGMRNLIESTLPASILQIYESRKFGASIFGLAVNIMSTFIHNEPTCLSILQEAKLPKTFLEVVTSPHLPISPEVVSAIPNAFGAVCLNSAGLEEFKAMPVSPIKSFFNIFTIQDQLKGLVDNDVPNLVGSSIDELMRHHPSLKDEVMSGVDEMLRKVLEIGKRKGEEALNLNNEEDKEDFCALFTGKSTMDVKGKQPVVSSVDEDIEMTEAGDFDDLTSPALASTTISAANASFEEADVSVKFVQFIDVVAKFLDGLFQNAGHAKEFARNHLSSVEILLQYVALPCIPFNFPSSGNFYSLGYVFRILIEVNSASVSKCIRKFMFDCFKQLRWIQFPDDAGAIARMVDMKDLSNEEIQKNQKIFRSLVSIHTVAKLLGDIFTTHVLSQNKYLLAACQLFGSEDPTSDDDFFNIYAIMNRICVVEGIHLKESVPANWYDYQKPKKVVLNQPAPSAASPVPFSSNVSSSEGLTNAGMEIVSDVENNELKYDYKIKNVEILKYLTGQISHQISITIQSAVKIFTGRRSSDSSLRKTIQEIFDNLASSMVDNLKWPRVWSDTNTTVKYRYLIKMLTNVSVLIVDDRNQHVLQTGLVHSFIRSGGMLSLLNILEFFWQESVRFTAITAPTDPKELTKHKELADHIENGLELTLAIFYTLTHSKLFHDSQHTSALSSREKDKSHPAYFDPYLHLVEMRFLVLPYIKNIWKSSDLKNAPPVVIKGIIQILVQILKAEGEIKTDASGGVELSRDFASSRSTAVDSLRRAMAGLPSASARPAVVADPTSLALLVDMGFSGTAAEAALIRCNNHVNRATEYILSHPELMSSATEPVASSSAPSPAVPPQPQPAEAGTSTSIEMEPEEAPHTENPDESINEDDDDDQYEDIDEDESDDEGDHPMNTAAMNLFDVLPAKIDDAGKKDEAALKFETVLASLNDLRGNVKQELLITSLSLLDHSNSDLIIFDVKELLCLEGVDDIEQILPPLIEEINKLLAAPDDTVGTRLQLFALIVNDPVLQTKAIMSCKPFIIGLIDIIETCAKPKTFTSRVLSSVLLILESYMSLADEPKPSPLEIKPESSTYKDLEPVEAPEPLLFAQRIQLLTHFNQILNNEELTTDIVHAILRLLVRLTRSPDAAAELLKIGGLNTLFNPTRIGLFEAQPTLTMMIVRHMFESKPTINAVMESEITQWFGNPRQRVVDLSTYIRNNAELACRDSACFVESTSKVCQLTKYDPSGRSRQITMKTLPKPLEKNEGESADKTEQEEKKEEVPLTPLKSALVVSTDSSEKLAQYLVSETLSLKFASEKTETAEGDAMNVDSPSSLDPISLHLKRCFLLQCISELAMSYPAFKLDVLSVSQRRGKGSVNKPSRNGFFNHLLNDLLPTTIQTNQTIEQAILDVEAKKKINQSTIAASVLTNLCLFNGDPQQEKKDYPEIINVRKSVFDAIAKSFKDAIASKDVVEKKYARFLALSDLCLKILSSRSRTATGIPGSYDEGQVHLAKLMLEKNMVHVFTQVVGEVDVHHPLSKVLLNAILRPLEIITKVAIRTGKTQEGGKDRTGTDPSYEDTSMNEIEGAVNQNEISDMFRNSSLGMFSAENEAHSSEEDDSDQGSGHSDEDSEMDEDDDDDEDDDVGMSYSDDDGSEEEEIESDVEDEMEIVVPAPYHNPMENGASSDEDDSHDDEFEQGDPLILDGGVENEGHMEGDEDNEGWEDEEGNPVVPGPFYDGTEDEEDEDDEDEDEDDDDGEMLEFDEDLFDMNDEGLQNRIARQITQQLRGNGMRMGRMARGQAGMPADFPIIVPAGAGNIGGSGGNFEIQLRASDLRPPGLPEIDGNGVRDFQVLGRSAPRTTDNTDIMQHPLLVNSAPSSAAGGSIRSRANIIREGGNVDWNSFDDLIGGNAVQLLEEIFRGALAGGRAPAGGELRVELNAPPGISLARRDSVSANVAASTSALPEAIETTSEEKLTEKRLNLIHSFTCSNTADRWWHEAKMMYGSSVAEKHARLFNDLLNVLIPPAIEEDARKKKEAAELMKKLAEENEQKRKLEQEKKEIAAQSKKKEEEKAALEKAEKDRIEAERLERERQEAPSSSVAPMEIEASVSNGPTIEQPPAGPSAPRNVVMINGNPVDITDTGIDPTFLEALPDDLKQDVLAQHLREQQALVRSNGGQVAEINSDFLAALPSDIREELEAETARAEGRGGGPSSAALSQDIDPASFLAALDSSLRQTVLLEQDDSFLSTLPPGMVAEANALRERISRSRLSRPTGSGLATSGTLTASGDQPSSKKGSGAPRESVQLVDKNAVMNLLRLLFVPEPVSKTLIHRLLVNVCENSKTRSELVSLLLSILVEGCTDLSSVDKIFSLTSKGRGKIAATPKKSSPTFVSSNLSPISGNIPNLVTQRCLETFIQVVHSNEQVSNLLLSENEGICTATVGGNGKPSRSSSKKGKEKVMPSSKYPINVLLGLLENSLFLKNSALMEQLSLLISTVLKPLGASLAKKPASLDKSQDNNTSTTESPTNLTPATSNAPTSMDIVEPHHASSTSNPTATPSTPNPTASTPAVTDSEKKVVSLKDSAKEVEVKVPVIPDHLVRAVVHVLTNSDCTSKSFQYILSIIQQLSLLANNRKIIMVELQESVQRLGDEILPDLKELLSMLEVSTSQSNIRTTVLSKFSLPSSLQSKLLRILKTLDFLNPSDKKTNPNEPVVVTNTVPETALNAIKIYDEFKLGDLWSSLGSCLEVIGSKSEMINVGTVMLPLIESFMVVSKPYVLPTHTRGTSVNNTKKSGDQQSNREFFFSFTEEHRKIINTMVRNNPSLMIGSFSLLVHNPKVLEFDNKRTYFNQQLHKRTTKEHYPSLQINVRRAYVFEDSYHQLQGRTGKEIKYGKLSVRFHDEEGVDAGGVSREWFTTLVTQMFNPNYALFLPSAADKVTYQPNRSSGINPDHLSYFKFVGRIIGKAIYDGKLLDCYFTRSFYKFMLGIDVDWKDMEAVDPEFHKSLEWIMNNDITDVLDLTFSCEVKDFGKETFVNLKENGANIPVTEENKEEYVRLITEQKLSVAIKDQISAFLVGFHEIIPKDLITIFNEQETELLISGLPDIDLDDMRNNTEYHNYTSTSVQVQWFWRVVRSFSQEQRAKLIQFVTGTSKVPLEGFSNLKGSSGIQKFNIHKDFSSNQRLPSAHTCFNQLDLPEYDSYEILKSNLLLAMNECGSGFGFA